MDSRETAQGSPLASLPSKGLPQVGIEVVLPGGEIHFLLPSLFPQQLGGRDPEAFTVGFSTRPRAGSTSIGSFQSRTWRELGLRRRCRAGRLAGGGLETGGRGGSARLRGRARGFPTAALDSGRRDPSRTGSLREESGTRQPRSSPADRDLRLYLAVDPSPKSTPSSITPSRPSVHEPAERRPG